MAIPLVIGGAVAVGAAVGAAVGSFVADRESDVAVERQKIDNMKRANQVDNMKRANQVAVMKRAHEVDIMKRDHRVDIMERALREVVLEAKLAVERQKSSKGRPSITNNIIIEEWNNGDPIDIPLGLGSLPEQISSREIPNITNNIYIKKLRNANSINCPSEDGEMEEELDEDDYEAKDDSTIARNIGRDWRFMAYLLKFREAEIDDIEHEESTLRDRASIMLKRYRQKHPQYGKSILKALIKIGRKDLLNKKWGRNNNRPLYLKN